MAVRQARRGERGEGASAAQPTTRVPAGQAEERKTHGGAWASRIALWACSSGLPMRMTEGGQGGQPLSMSRGGGASAAGSSAQSTCLLPAEPSEALATSERARRRSREGSAGQGNVRLRPIARLALSAVQRAASSFRPDRSRCQAISRLAYWIRRYSCCRQPPRPGSRQRGWQRERGGGKRGRTLSRPTVFPRTARKRVRDGWRSRCEG